MSPNSEIAKTYPGQPFIFLYNLAILSGDVAKLEPDFFLPDRQRESLGRRQLRVPGGASQLQQAHQSRGTSPRLA